MPSFVCRKCKFIISRDKKPERCSYCGNPGTMDEKPSAQDLLNETIQDFDNIEEDRRSRMY